MSVTADTSQDAIGPFGPVAQSLPTLTHSPMAFTSTPFVLGVNTVALGVNTVVWGIDVD